MDSPKNFQAVIFDLDGVVTQTSSVHRVAWREMFNNYLKVHAERTGGEFQPFTDSDYLTYVDGKPRYDGVASFLESRGIELPFGSPTDGIDKESVCGLGNAKDKAFNHVLARDGVAVFSSTVELILTLKKLGVKIGVASSSKNCALVLDKANLTDLFAVRVDGVVSAELGLKGKPATDLFVKAAELLGVPPSEAIVVEDAVSGVQAGRAGGFALVLGLAREDNEEELAREGAHFVVKDLEGVGVEDLVRWLDER